MGTGAGGPLIPQIYEKIEEKKIGKGRSRQNY